MEILAALLGAALITIPLYGIWYSLDTIGNNLNKMNNHLDNMDDSTFGIMKKFSKRTNYTKKQIKEMTEYLQKEQDKLHEK